MHATPNRASVLETLSTAFNAKAVGPATTLDALFTDLPPPDTQNISD